MLFRVGLTLVRLALGATEQRLACPGLLETLSALRAIPPAQLQEEVFMPQVGAPRLPGKLSPRAASQSKNQAWSSRHGTVEMNLTSIQRMQVRSLASPSGLRIRRCRELWRRSQTRLRSHVVVAVV